MFKDQPSTVNTSRSIPTVGTNTSGVGGTLMNSSQFDKDGNLILGGQALPASGQSRMLAQTPVPTRGGGRVPPTNGGSGTTPGTGGKVDPPGTTPGTGSTALVPKWVPTGDPIRTETYGNYRLDEYADGGYTAIDTRSGETFSRPPPGSGAPITYTLTDGTVLQPYKMPPDQPLPLGAIPVDGGAIVSVPPNAVPPTGQIITPGKPGYRPSVDTVINAAGLVVAAVSVPLAFLPYIILNDDAPPEEPPTQPPGNKTDPVYPEYNGGGGGGVGRDPPGTAPGGGNFNKDELDCYMKCCNMYSGTPPTGGTTGTTGTTTTTPTTYEYTAMDGTIFYTIQKKPCKVTDEIDSYTTVDGTIQFTKNKVPNKVSENGEILSYELYAIKKFMEAGGKCTHSPKPPKPGKHDSHSACSCSTKHSKPKPKPKPKPNKGSVSSSKHTGKGSRGSKGSCGSKVTFGRRPSRKPIRRPSFSSQSSNRGVLCRRTENGNTVCAVAPPPMMSAPSVPNVIQTRPRPKPRKPRLTRNAEYYRLKAEQLQMKEMLKNPQNFQGAGCPPCIQNCYSPPTQQAPPQSQFAPQYQQNQNMPQNFGGRYF